VHQGKSVQFFSLVLPETATYYIPSYIITEGEEYAVINLNGLLTVNGNAPIGAVIKVRSVADGVYSNELTVTVIAAPTG